MGASPLITHHNFGWLAVVFVWQVMTVCPALHAEDLDLSKIPADLVVPDVSVMPPAAGRRVKVILPEQRDTQLYFALYLPTDWKAGQKHPVIVEYPGNGPFRNARGDTSSGKLEDCALGYGATAGKGCVWICLPFVNTQTKAHQLQWWGDADATAKYCEAAVDHVCREFGGDRDRLILAGFSRGAIACNYIGLRNDHIAGLWKGFIAHSHYDGVRRWPYPDSDRASAQARLKRLAGRPQFVSHEASIDETRKFINDSLESDAGGQFTFVALPFLNHTSQWVLRDTPARRELRAWLERTLK